MTDASLDTPVRRRGRPRDVTRDTVILEAALDVLAQYGYDRTTIDLVAERAGTVRATVYRRWPTKLDLVVDAVRLLAPSVSTEPVDTGTLRGDCLALIQPEDGAAARRRVDVVASMQVSAATEPRLAQVLPEAGVDPWIRANRIVLRRAVDRGEIPEIDVELYAQVIPLICASRAAIQQLPITAEYAHALVDEVLLPAVRAARPVTTAGRTAPCTPNTGRDLAPNPPHRTGAPR